MRSKKPESLVNEWIMAVMIWHEKLIYKVEETVII